MNWVNRLVAALRAAAKGVPDEGIVEGDAVDVMRQLATGSFDHALIDPPYSIAKGRGLAWEFSSHVTLEAAWDQFATVDDYVAFTRAWLDELLRVVKRGGNVVVFGSYHNIHLVGAEVQRRDLRIVNEIVWEKTNAQPNITGRMFCECAEFALWFVNASNADAENWQFNYAAMKAENGDKQMRSVWRLPTTPASEKRWGKHPTQKSLAVMGRLVRALTKPGERILDCFAGSGTTVVSAYEHGRVALGIERDPESAALAKRRVAAVDEPELETSPAPATPVADPEATAKNLARKLWALAKTPAETAAPLVVAEYMRIVELAGPPLVEPGEEPPPSSAPPATAAVLGAAETAVVGAREDEAGDEDSRELPAVPAAGGDGAQDLVAAAAPSDVVVVPEESRFHVAAQLATNEAPSAVVDADGRVVLEDVARQRSGDGA